ncbi:MAG: hypothetical protein AB1894_15775 [Chloroflexota bacterium]
MRIAIYIISALLTNYVFSLVTTLLVVAGIEKMGSDPGSPGIMLFSLLCICGILSIATATIMGIGKAKYHKEFPAKFSALIFLFTYFPAHIIGLYVPYDEKLDFLAAPLGGLLAIMMLFSYIPFFHMTAQGLVNLYEFVKRQELAGNRYAKFFVLAGIGGIVLLTGWLMSRPATGPLPKVMSLQENWIMLESGGRDWQSDAYLNEITFDVNRVMPYKISATYLSKSTPDEQYSIYINAKGEIFNKETSKNYPMRETAKLPINREDWAIESTQAWEMFFKDETLSTCVAKRDPHVWMYMALRRTMSGRLAWELAIGGCPDEAVRSHHYYLDAKTGEIIESYSQ